MLILRPWLAATHVVEQSRELGQVRIHSLCPGQVPDVMPHPVGVQPAMGWAAGGL
jgi:hypothetical protein